MNTRIGSLLLVLLVIGCSGGGGSSGPAVVGPEQEVIDLWLLNSTGETLREIRWRHESSEQWSITRKSLVDGAQLHFGRVAEGRWYFEADSETGWNYSFERTLTPRVGKTLVGFHDVDQIYISFVYQLEPTDSACIEVSSQIGQHNERDFRVSDYNEGPVYCGPLEVGQRIVVKFGSTANRVFRVTYADDSLPCAEEINGHMFTEGHYEIPINRQYFAPCFSEPGEWSPEPEDGWPVPDPFPLTAAITIGFCCPLPDGEIGIAEVLDLGAPRTYRVFYRGPVEPQAVIDVDIPSASRWAFRVRRQDHESPDCVESIDPVEILEPGTVVPLDPSTCTNCFTDPMS